MAQLNITLNTELLHGLFTKDSKDEAFSKLMETILNQVLLAQSAEQLGAQPYERSNDRTAYRNGFRDRELTTRIGSISLRIPRHRNGNFSTSMFERYQRSEPPLIWRKTSEASLAVCCRSYAVVRDAWQTAYHISPHCKQPFAA